MKGSCWKRLRLMAIQLAVVAVVVAPVAGHTHPRQTEVALTAEHTHPPQTGVVLAAERTDPWQICSQRTIQLLRNLARMAHEPNSPICRGERVAQDIFVYASACE